MSDDQFNKLSEEQQVQIRALQEKYVDEIKVVLREARQLEKEANAELIKLEKEVASFAINSMIEEVEEKYQTVPDVMRHLGAVREDILGNLAAFLRHDRPNPELLMAGAPDVSFAKRYEVNVLVDNASLQGAPVVLDLHPTYNNLTGRVEKESMMGAWITDHTLIRKGSLHSANGGFLIIRADDLFKNAFSWENLKRALKNKELVIEEAGDQWGLFTTKTLKPTSIPLNVKVVLIGNPFFYTLLYTYDPDFRELFKVKADFDVVMDRSNDNLGDYINFCFTLSEKEKLTKLNDEAIARIIEHGSRLAEDQQKLTARFSEIADVVREANHYAAQEHATEINGTHIQRAIEEKNYRSNLIQYRLNEMIGRHQILIETGGKKVGQVNGLSVINLGDMEFGIPNRITCSTSLGKEGIIAIEREAELSGPIHTKGVMILGGYLSEKFIQEKPISLSARFVFEQNYSEIEGDSASSAELYTLLSSLAEVPIRQGIAVTGSVNQKGEIQAIGGVNEKIEGYYEVCKMLGWNREQGVIIPSSNVQNLMLKEEIAEAVKQNLFKIWAIDTIDEGIEILTNYKYGSTEEAGTIAYLVNNKLSEYATRMKEFALEIEEEQEQD
jgi:lon-related putative ATP-dependent protease